ncbi:MAG TPA: SpoIVB peptidase S55 domain-containing protein, partial [Thermoanaerobaculia bacterium]|nr:SpoIVB peptidase S55 domain-containing protein [Thermoanaerobaculia bacterium]
MRKHTAGFLLAAVLAAGTAAASPPILEVSGIHPGQKGYGLCDFGGGAGVQRFGVEILGVMREYAPKQDLILARLTGDNLEKTGVIAGMSGSPVYVEDKLIGAVAYGWPFSEEAIAGITPIASMLDIRHVPANPPV